MSQYSILLIPKRVEKMSCITPVILSTLLILCSLQIFAQKTRLSTQVDALFTEWNGGNTPGAALLVMRDGKVLIKKGYGLANIETKSRITSDTHFLLGSVTKQFTAMAVMILAERGQLSYDDSLAKFFPQFPPYAQKITIRNSCPSIMAFGNSISELPIFIQDRSLTIELTRRRDFTLRSPDQLSCETRFPRSRPTICSAAARNNGPPVQAERALFEVGL